MPNKMYRKIIIIFLIAGLLGSFVGAMDKAPKPSKSKTIDFTLSDLNGKSHTLSKYKGKVIFLNFWATWCPPCRAEMPAMQKMYKSWNSKKYVMLAVNIGQDKQTVKSFANKNGYTFPILLDSTSKIARKYRVSGIPTTYIINKEGKIVTRIVGAREWDLKQIERLLK